jgi:hypothetical protein
MNQKDSKTLRSNRRQVMCNVCRMAMWLGFVLMVSCGGEDGGEVGSELGGDDVAEQGEEVLETLNPELLAEVQGGLDVGTEAVADADVDTADVDTDTPSEPACPPDCGPFISCGAAGCSLDLATSPTGPPAPCPDADLPPRDCVGDEAYCGELITFAPRSNASWDDYPVNGETEEDQYRSFGRRDLVMLLQWATAYTACMSAGWAGNGPPLGIGDMSEADGAIPGTSIGQPGHPAGTHTDGFDVNLAYYQQGTEANLLGSVCQDTLDGELQYHCVAPPYLLDPWRTALLVGALATSDRLRMIAVDGQIGLLLDEALPVLCAAGWLPALGCDEIGSHLAYEIEDEGMGIYRFHHWIIYLSTMAP